MKQCNCLEEAEKRTVEMLETRTNNPSGFQITESEWENCSIYPNTELYTRIKYTHTFTKKDGTTSSEKSSNINIFFTFCPFCGTKRK